jgi:sensor histidine kinase YesM
MTFTKSWILKEVKMLTLFAGVSIVQTLLMCPGCNSFQSYFRTAAFIFCMWALLWEGNSFLTHYINRTISWIEWPLKRFLVGLASTIVYSLTAIFFLIFIFRDVFNFNFGDSIRVTVLTSLLLTLLVTLFVHSRDFLFHWRRSILEAERFQRESIESRYESLKNRVNPQLLFKSLQTLRTLVHSDKENAVKFIRQLAEVYRYILESREKDIVAIERELRFLRSFFFLLEARFGNMIRLRISVPPREFFVSPLSIQIIIETLIENSTPDAVTPLEVSVSFAESTTRILAENICWKGDTEREKTADVLKSIEARYRLLSSVPIRFEINDRFVSCDLPEITTESQDVVERPLNALLR